MANCLFSCRSLGYSVVCLTSGCFYSFGFCVLSFIQGMSRVAAWCVLAIFRFASVINRVAYSLLDCIFEFVNTVLKGYLYSVDEIPIPISNIREVECQKRQFSKSTASRCPTQLSKQQQQPSSSRQTKKRKPVKITINRQEFSKKNKLSDSGVEGVSLSDSNVVFCDLNKAQKVILSYEFMPRYDRNNTTSETDCSTKLEKLDDVASKAAETYAYNKCSEEQRDASTRENSESYPESFPEDDFDTQGQQSSHGELLEKAINEASREESDGEREDEIKTLLTCAKALETSLQLKSREEENIMASDDTYSKTATQLGFSENKETSNTKDAGHSESLKITTDNFIFESECSTKLEKLNTVEIKTTEAYSFNESGLEKEGDTSTYRVSETSQEGGILEKDFDTKPHGASRSEDFDAKTGHKSYQGDSAGKDEVQNRWSIPKSLDIIQQPISSEREENIKASNEVDSEVMAQTDFFDKENSKSIDSSQTIEIPDNLKSERECSKKLSMLDNVTKKTTETLHEFFEERRNASTYKDSETSHEGLPEEDFDPHVSEASRSEHFGEKIIHKFPHGDSACKLEDGIKNQLISPKSLTSLQPISSEKENFMASKYEGTEVTMVFDFPDNKENSNPMDPSQSQLVTHNMSFEVECSSELAKLDTVVKDNSETYESSNEEGLLENRDAPRFQDSESSRESFFDKDFDTKISVASDSETLTEEIICGVPHGDSANITEEEIKYNLSSPKSPDISLEQKRNEEICMASNDSDSEVAKESEFSDNKEDTATDPVQSKKLEIFQENSESERKCSSEFEKLKNVKTTEPSQAFNKECLDENKDASPNKNSEALHDSFHVEFCTKTSESYRSENFGEEKMKETARGDCADELDHEIKNQLSSPKTLGICLQQKNSERENVMTPKNTNSEVVTIERDFSYNENRNVTDPRQSQTLDLIPDNPTSGVECPKIVELDSVARKSAETSHVSNKECSEELKDTSTYKDSNSLREESSSNRSSAEDFGTKSLKPTSGCEKKDEINLSCTLKEHHPESSLQVAESETGLDSSTCSATVHPESSLQVAESETGLDSSTCSATVHPNNPFEPNTPVLCYWKASPHDTNFIKNDMELMNYIKKRQITQHPHEPFCPGNHNDSQSDSDSSSSEKERKLKKNLKKSKKPAS